MSTPYKNSIKIAVIIICCLISVIIFFAFKNLFLSSQTSIDKNKIIGTSDNYSQQNLKIIDSTKEKIQLGITYILDVYPKEIDLRKKEDEQRHGFQVHVQTPTWMVIKSKLLREGFKRISGRDFKFNNYNGVFNRFKATLSNTDTVFFESESYYGKKVVIAIAVNNTGVKDREILIQ